MPTDGSAAPDMDAFVKERALVAAEAVLIDFTPTERALLTDHVKQARDHVYAGYAQALDDLVTIGRGEIILQLVEGLGGGDVN